MARRSSHKHHKSVNPARSATQKRLGDISAEHREHMLVNVRQRSPQLFEMHGRLLARGFALSELVGVIADPSLGNPRATHLQLGIQHVDTFLESTPLGTSDRDTMRAQIAKYIGEGKLPVAYVSKAGIAIVWASEKHEAGADGGVS